MSYSADVKKEIANVEPKKECCQNTLSDCYDISRLEDGMIGKCCVKTFLRRAFIDFGSVNDPNKSYHLEFVLPDEIIASLIFALVIDYNMIAKIMVRKSSYVVYIKESESIADFLKLIGANKALMEFENIRIIKEMRSNINRSVNCESANIQKKVDAAFKQLKSIEYIRDTVGLEYLAEDLREIAVARLENHDMGLAELGESLGNRLSKSGVNHRMSKILNIANKLMDKGELDSGRKDSSI